MTRLAVVVGSVRPNRVGGTIAQWVVDQANEIEGVDAELVDIAAFHDAEVPAMVRDVVAHSDALASLR